MSTMTTVELLTEQAKGLPEPLLKEVLDFIGFLRAKYALSAPEAWDKQIEADALSGELAFALDGLADAALAEHQAGKTSPL